MKKLIFATLLSLNFSLHAMDVTPPPNLYQESPKAAEYVEPKKDLKPKKTRAELFQKNSAKVILPNEQSNIQILELKNNNNPVNLTQGYGTYLTPTEIEWLKLTHGIQAFTSDRMIHHFFNNDDRTNQYNITLLIPVLSIKLLNSNEKPIPAILCANHGFNAGIYLRTPIGSIRIADPTEDRTAFILKIEYKYISAPLKSENTNNDLLKTLKINTTFVYNRVGTLTFHITPEYLRNIEANEELIQLFEKALNQNDLESYFDLEGLQSLSELQTLSEHFTFITQQIPKNHAEELAQRKKAIKRSTSQEFEKSKVDLPGVADAPTRAVTPKSSFWDRFKSKK